MKAQEIMVREVVTTLPTTPVSEIARLLVERHISGIPVVSADGTLLGLVSQSDLLHRVELGTERKRKGWLRIFVDPDRIAREFTKSHGLKAYDIMSRHVVSVRADADLGEVASVLDTHQIKRVPVIEGGKLVGIITRGDLVRALSQQQTARTDRKIDDGALQKLVLESVRKQSWLNSSFISVTVKDAVVELWGMSESASQRQALRVMIEGIEGVASVHDNVKVGILNYYAI